MNKYRNKLKIAQIAPISERVPPKKYGGTERVIHALTEELIKRGHDITLFASGDSETKAKLVSIYPRSLREAKIPDPYGINELTLLNIGNAYKRQLEFDIIHDHNHIVSLQAAHFSKTPVIMTLHGPFTTINKKLFETLDNPYFVTISESQTKKAPNIKIVDTIYNGLPLENYPFQKNHGQYLLFVGRISLEKGLHFAIDVAVNLNMPLIIAAKLDLEEADYFNTYINPRLNNDHVKWIGEVDEKKRNELMKGALCLLHPVTWPEPFGLTMVEAMACGTPVIAFRRGSIPEIIKDGKTGFIVEDLEEMIEAVDKIYSIDRMECRRYVISKFNSKTMTEKYLHVYEAILNSYQRYPLTHI